MAKNLVRALGAKITGAAEQTRADLIQRQVGLLLHQQGRRHRDEGGGERRSGLAARAADRGRGPDIDARRRKGNIRATIGAAINLRPAVDGGHGDDLWIGRGISGLGGGPLFPAAATSMIPAACICPIYRVRP